MIEPFGEVVSPEVQSAGQQLRAGLAAYREKEDLIAIGAYQRGSDPLVDSAIALRPQIDAFLKQAVDEHTTAEAADERLLAIAAELGGEGPQGLHGGPEPAPAAVVSPAPAIPALNLN